MKKDGGLRQQKSIILKDLDTFRDQAIAQIQANPYILRRWTIFDKICSFLLNYDLPKTPYGELIDCTIHEYKIRRKLIISNNRLLSQVPKQ